MLPAHQRLDPGRVVGAAVRVQPDHRLVHDEQLFLGQRGAQLGLDVGAARGAFAHAGLEHHVACAAGALGLDHGNAGVAHHGVGIGRGVVRPAVHALAPEHADAGAAGHLAPGHPMRAVQGVEQAHCRALGLVALAQAVEQDHEFVAAHARHQVAAAGGGIDAARARRHAPAAFGHRRQQFVGQGHQQLVAEGLAEGVVDLAEAVEVQEQQGELAAACMVAGRGALQHRLQLLAHGGAVRQARQGVGAGGAAQAPAQGFLLALHLQRGVGDYRHQALGVELQEADR